MDDDADERPDWDSLTQFAPALDDTEAPRSEAAPTEASNETILGPPPIPDGSVFADATPPIVSPPDPVDAGSAGTEAPVVDIGALLEPPESAYEVPPQPELPPIVDRTPDTSRPLLALVGGIVGVGVMAATWWALTRGSEPVVDPADWPSPRTTWDTFRDEIDGDFFDHVAASFGRFVAAFTIGGLLGTAAGFLTGAVPAIRSVLRPFTGLFLWVSPVLLIPFAVLWFGIGSRIWMVAALGVFSLVAWQTSGAVSDSAAGRSTNRLERIISGWRAAAPLAWALVFVYELLIAREGVGEALFRAQQFFRVDLMVVYLLTALVLAVGTDLVLRVLQHGARR